MRPLQWLGATLVVLSLAGCSGKDKKDDKGAKSDTTNTETSKSATTTPQDKTQEGILGKWLLVKADKVRPDDFILEFKKDGKMTQSVSPGPKPIVTDGTYKIEGDKLTVTLSSGKPWTDKIKSLSSAELVLVADDGETMQFKKK